MPLFLASAKYLGACSVNAVFIEDRMETRSTEYARTTKRYTECASPVAMCKTLFGARDPPRKPDGFHCGVGLP
jgi:hypothetical protein